jgi:hypothetical protein
MFGLFSSPRKKALKRANVFFQNQFSDLCKWDDEKVGSVLDFAAKIKMHSMDLDTTGEAERIYTNPSSVSEGTCLAQLELYHAKMIGWAQDAIAEARYVEGVSVWESRARKEAEIRRAALSIWYFSLAAGCFGEFRQNGFILWNQLKRGYPHATFFDPEKDSIKEFASPSAQE